MTVQAVVDLMEGYSRLVDRQPKNFYRHDPWRGNKFSSYAWNTR